LATARGAERHTAGDMVNALLKQEIQIVESVE
jgi:hypothetical protein